VSLETFGRGSPLQEVGRSGGTSALISWEDVGKTWGKYGKIMKKMVLICFDDL
jgi:hypothetical protein